MMLQMSSLCLYHRSFGACLASLHVPSSDVMVSVGVRVSINVETGHCHIGL